MKKAEKQVVILVAKLFMEGKLNFTYFFNPSAWSFEISKNDHEFIAEYNGLAIRLCRRNLIVDSKETADRERFVIRLTKELKQIYKELYHKHEPEIKEVLENHKLSQKPEKYDTKLTDGKKSNILKKLQ